MMIIIIIMTIIIIIIIVIIIIIIMIIIGDFRALPGASWAPLHARFPKAEPAPKAELVVFVELLLLFHYYY